MDQQGELEFFLLGWHCVNW